MPCPTCSGEYPCGCVACPSCPLMAAKGDLGHVCACGWREDRCDCGALMTFDPEARGLTCGGLNVVGFMVCIPCGVTLVCNKSAPADPVDWALAKGGLSVTCGGIKIRAEKGDRDTVLEVMARISRLPELEIENDRMRRLLRTRP